MLKIIVETGRGCVGGYDNVEINWKSHVSADKIYKTVNLNVEFL
jgi:hypothetical protein